jgi:hypothetical protein
MTSLSENGQKAWCASFDIGSKNFSFYIEEVDLESMAGIENIPFESRYNPDGTPTEKMGEILEKVYKTGTTVLHKNLNLTSKCCGTKYFDTTLFVNMIHELDHFQEYWDKCLLFVVEQQMSLKSKFNTKALKLGQHCQSYFYFRYGSHKKVLEFPAYHKTRILGCRKLVKGKYKNGRVKYVNIDKPSRKKWSVQKAIEIAKMRGETDSILLHNEMREEEGKKFRKIKLDDYADTLTQLQAFKYLYFIDNADI